MNENGSSSTEEKKSAPPQGAQSGADPVPPQETTEINRTMVMPSSRTIPIQVNPSGKSGAKSRRNLSARFSLEVFRKKSSEKEIVDEYFGRNLTRFTNRPIDNSPEIPPEIMPELG